MKLILPGEVPNPDLLTISAATLQPSPILSKKKDQSATRYEAKHLREINYTIPSIPENLRYPVENKFF